MAFQTVNLLDFLPSITIAVNGLTFLLFSLLTRSLTGQPHLDWRHDYPIDEALSAGDLAA